MPCPNPRDRSQCDPLSPVPKDKKAERAVLAFLIYKHPDERLTIPGLSRALNEGGGFNEGDAVERAVRELVGAGLLEMDGPHVVPTKAALYYDALEAD